jgi:hypothetical protein
MRDKLPVSRAYEYCVHGKYYPAKFSDPGKTCRAMARPLPIKARKTGISIFPVSAELMPACIVRDKAGHRGTPKPQIFYPFGENAPLSPHRSGEKNDPDKSRRIYLKYKINCRQSRGLLL